MIEGTRPITAHAWEQVSEQLKLPSLHGRQTAIIVEIDGFASFEELFSDSNQKLLMFSLMNVYHAAADRIYTDSLHFQQPPNQDFNIYSLARLYEL